MTAEQATRVHANAEARPPRRSLLSMVLNPERLPMLLLPVLLGLMQYFYGPRADDAARARAAAAAAALCEPICERVGLTRGRRGEQHPQDHRAVPGCP